MENYREKYEKVLSHAKQAIDNIPDKSLAKWLQSIFPELKESEGKRMQRELIEYLNERRVTERLTDTRVKEEWIAWLEKQKERGPLSKDEEYTLARIIEYLEDNGCPSKWKDLLYDVYALPYQKERKHAGWSEEDERICQCLIEDQEEELNKMKNNKYGHSEIISDLKETYNERIDWLKSLKQRMKGE